MIPIAQPLVGEAEKQAVLAVLDSGLLAQGEQVAAFEREFAELCGVPDAVAVCNGTAALHLALLAHGIGSGDEVITSPFTFIASANSALFVGARPVFVDVQSDTYNLDPAQLEAKITPRTRAIMPVHLYGNPCDLDAIAAIAKRHDLVIVEDAAQAHGAAVGARTVGSFGTACFSFYPTKNMTTAEGGIVTTADPDIAERLRMLRHHGARQRYYHEILGYNFRMTDLQAAIGRAQLGHLEAWTERRIASADYLSRNLRGVTVPVSRPGHRHVYHQYVVRVPGDRDAFADRLQAAGIGTAVHYPIPVHQQPLYRDLGYADSLPEAERAAREVLSLPVHPALTQTDLDQIVAAVNRETLSTVS
ncbi:MAG: DegT/DnrJ/EryC1/StrS family aminotransferase [Chloroflexi bacterium]|nr:DegT/DnrJ/EryC1/StrS family aminotransferase [Chloroflexota bacterium]